MVCAFTFSILRRMTDSSSSASSASSLSLCCAVSDSLSSWAETVVATLADCFIWTLVLALLEVSSSSLQLQSLLCMRFLRAHLLRALLLHFNFSGIRTRTYTCNLVDVHMLHVSHAPGSSSADLFLGMPRRYMLTPRDSQPKCARDGAAHLQLRRTSSSADLPLGVHGQYMFTPRHLQSKCAVRRSAVAMDCQQLTLRAHVHATWLTCRCYKAPTLLQLRRPVPRDAQAIYVDS